MTISLPKLMVAGTILAAAAISAVTAVLAVGAIESRTAQEVRTVFLANGISWAKVVPDGTQVHLSGTAPDEAARFRALSAAGRVLDSTHVIDDIKVSPSTPLDAPRFTVELLRNESGISVIGLIPDSIERADIVAELRKIGDDLPVTEMLQVSDHEMPAEWDAAMDFAMKALERLERAKISISGDRVAVTAISDSPAEKAKIERDLRRAAPRGIEVALNISAPRPVIAPFTLRFRLDGDGARFDACSADTEDAAERILAAGRRAGMIAPGRCTVGLGVPAPQWGAAVERGIDAVAALGGGTLTFSDADVSLLALPGTDSRLFDSVAGELEADLPEVFALNAILPEPPEEGQTDEGPREFIATLSPEGLVQLRGRVPDAMLRDAASSYARSRFGQDQVYAAMRVDPGLPEGWPLRVLAGLEALSQLRNGSLMVDPDRITLQGLTEDEDATARVTRILTDRLGEAEDFEIAITYRPPPEEPVSAGPTPEDCVASIREILARDKIIFAPGSTRIEGAAVRVIDRIADVLRTCPDAQIEIGGHTDSQGREGMNQQLSQQRADAVLTALMARRVLTSNLTAKGYGESQPIAGNDTEDGREANRRIEFRLLVPEGTDEPAGDGSEAAAPDAPADSESDGTAAAAADSGDAPAAEGAPEQDGPDDAAPAETTPAEAGGSDTAPPAAEGEGTEDTAGPDAAQNDSGQTPSAPDPEQQTGSGPEQETGNGPD